jgi:uncharacterized FAD-dependent dehydrogenase
MRGYLTNEAILHAPESRTSSPVRIPRDPITYEHLQIKGLYPCGEGAGMGGIISAAIDGEKCAIMIAESLKKKPRFNFTKSRLMAVKCKGKNKDFI